MRTDGDESEHNQNNKWPDFQRFQLIFFQPKINESYFSLQSLPKCIIKSLPNPFLFAKDTFTIEKSLPIATSKVKNETNCLQRPLTKHEMILCEWANKQQHTEQRGEKRQVDEGSSKRNRIQAIKTFSSTNLQQHIFFLNLFRNFSINKLRIFIIKISTLSHSRTISKRQGNFSNIGNRGMLKTPIKRRKIWKAQSTKRPDFGDN